MNSYKDLIVYQKAVDLSVSIYKITEDFPKSELYGLINQIRKCAVSIPSNIAEGQRRGSRKEYIQFLRISFGSGAELETQLLIAFRVGYLNKDKFEMLSQKLDEIMRMLNRLISVLVNNK
ncbi:MAG: four helix bundle protein [Candidatus Levybacteria bacterium RIFCSPHIGHO2_01_FULL_40_10]|nr:MAG: four helix bundle protein [Candidatus Levybacteria bacterium RIFCSPHIGHO2_01_FULL_40_10]